MQKIGENKDKRERERYDTPSREAVNFFHFPL